MGFQNYEILLFAEDVVSYLMNTKLMWRQTGFCSSDVAPRAGEYRHVVYNGFSEIVKKTVDVLYETHFFSIQRQYTKILETDGHIDDESLKKYAKFLWEQHFSDGIDAIRFLRFCVVLTALAGAFYLEGFKKSPDYAVQIIVYHFPRAECLKVTWNVLSRAALRYLKEKTGKSYSQIFDNLDDDLPSCMDFKNEYTCNCFKIDLKGPSFKKLYAMRENVLRYHFIICLKANFGEAYNQNFIRPTEDYKTEYHIPSASNMEDQHFSGNRSSMSAIHKISQAARLSEKSSSNYNHKISRNNEVIPSNHESHTDKSLFLKISRSDKSPEKSTDTLSQSSVKEIPKQMNHQRNSVIVRNPQSFKRFKMSDSGNVDNNKAIPLKSDLNNYPTYHSDENPIAKLSEMFLNLESMSDNGNVYNGDRISPRKSVICSNPTHLAASYHTAKLSERLQNMESIPYSRNVNNGNKVIPLKSDLYDYPTHQPDNDLIANPSEMFQGEESMYDNEGKVSNGNRLGALISDLYNYPTHQPDNHPIMKLSEMFQNIESILKNIQTMKNRQKLK